MNGFFEYICNFFDCTVDNIVKVHGIVYASSFKDAMEKLESYYGEEIDSIKLTGAELSDVYEFERDPIEFILTVKKKREKKMAKDRERVCEWYKNEGNCSKGHEGIFNKTCQKCKDYRAKKGALPRRKNLRKEKNLKWMNNIKNFE